MLVAEIHGKRVLEAQNSEDYLTSAVFGHLRYVPPGVFWSRLFQKALSLPIDGVDLYSIDSIDAVADLLAKVGNRELARA